MMDRHKWPRHLIAAGNWLILLTAPVWAGAWIWHRTWGERKQLLARELRGKDWIL